MVYSPQKSPKSQHATHPCQPCPRKQSFDPLGDFRHTIRDPFKLTRELSRHRTHQVRGADGVSWQWRAWEIPRVKHLVRFPKWPGNLGPNPDSFRTFLERLEGPTSPELVQWNHGSTRWNFTISWVVYLKECQFYPTHRGDVAN